MGEIGTMIEVTKFGGERIVVNADHIESVEANPDTALVLNNGKRIVIKDEVAEVVSKVIEYQRTIRSQITPRVSITEDADTLGTAGKATKAD